MASKVTSAIVEIITDTPDISPEVQLLWHFGAPTERRSVEKDLISF